MKKFIYTVLVSAPGLAFAQQTTDLGNVSRLIASIGRILNQVIPVFFAVAVVYFFYGVVQFLMGAGDEKKHAAGKAHMIYGVIAIAVMVSLFGLVAWLQGTIGINPQTSVTLPTVQF